jgi:hypothetical protein
MHGIRCCNSWKPAPGTTNKRHLAYPTACLDVDLNKVLPKDLDS